MITDHGCCYKSMLWIKCLDSNRHDREEDLTATATNQRRTHGALGWSTPAACLNTFRDNVPGEHT